jgi:hypothetical protein
MKLAQKKSCSNCINGVAIPVNDDILCRYKGAVSRDYICSKHRSAPPSKASCMEYSFKCIHCENFIITSKDPVSSTTIGLCQLFSVRSYVGEEKNACSKFIKSSEAVNY